jgi:hypothetical protein
MKEIVIVVLLAACAVLSVQATAHVGNYFAVSDWDSRTREWAKEWEQYEKTLPEIERGD